jgi:hypothetical protein
MVKSSTHTCLSRQLLNFVLAPLIFSCFTCGCCSVCTGKSFASFTYNTVCINVSSTSLHHYHLAGPHCTVQLRNSADVAPLTLALDCCPWFNQNAEGAKKIINHVTDVRVQSRHQEVYDGRWYRLTKDQAVEYTGLGLFGERVTHCSPITLTFSRTRTSDQS